MPATSTLDQVRARLGDRYAVDRELGRGGMGAVYLARDVQLDRPVALKVLPPEFAADPSLRERFLRETRVAASFSHPNIVPVYAVEDRDGLLAFAMGYVEGESLAERVKRAGPLDIRTIVRVLQDIGYALAYAHGRGVVHRDIKPDNIMIERATGRALLMDFGISRPITSTAAAPGLTRVGEVVGTPEFMSPEQASGDTVDGRTDLYSLGLVALFALTGTKPITGTSTQQIIVKQLTEVLPPASTLRSGIPAALGDSIDRCVAKAPDARFRTAEALVDAIDAAQLAAPEIPLPIRLFAQDLGTLSLVAFFLLIMFPLIARGMSAGGLFDAAIPVLLITAVIITRAMMSFSSARRLAADGYSADDILKGMRAVAEERLVVREAYRANPAVLAHRKKTLRIASVMVVTAVVLVVVVARSAVKAGPARYHVGLLGLIALVVAVIWFGVGMMLLLRSPFRAPPGDRIFETVWLGPLGRGFVRLAARNVPRTTTPARAVPAAAAVPAATAAPSAIAPAPAAQVDRLAELEARLAALEKKD
ncbi:MAG TPA: serine/threonine-protein kinase [Gemmatimonadales bacterium]|jgi:serine/threonine-protein kinase